MVIGKDVFEGGIQVRGGDLGKEYTIHGVTELDTTERLTVAHTHTKIHRKLNS